METKQVSPSAALNEYVALAEFYRQRNLLLADELLSAVAERDALREEVEQLRAEEEGGAQ